MKCPALLFAASFIVVALGISYAGEGGHWQLLPAAMGVVTAVDQKTITVAGYPESRTITVMSNTVFTKQVEGKIEDIKKGAKIVVIGKPSEDGRAAAARIIVLDLSQTINMWNLPQRKKSDSDNLTAFHLRPVGASSGTLFSRHIVRPDGFTLGEVTNVSPLTVKTHDDKLVTVETGLWTRVSMTKDASLADVKKGEFITVFGKPDADGTIKAESVHIGVRRGGESR